MPAPNAKMKIDKDGVHFEESVDRANYFISELTRAALKDVAKYVLRIVRKEVRGISNYTKKMRYAGMRYQYWVRKKECDLQLGIENTSKGADSSWWADQAELGTGSQPKRGFLTSAVYDNIDQIRKIEAQYLSGIETEDESLIDEEENNPEEDDVGE